MSSIVLHFSVIIVFMFYVFLMIVFTTAMSKQRFYSLTYNMNFGGCEWLVSHCQTSQCGSAVSAQENILCLVYEVMYKLDYYSCCNKYWLKVYSHYCLLVSLLLKKQLHLIVVLSFGNTLLWLQIHL